MSSAINYTYKYPFESTLEPNPKGLGLDLATCDARHAHPHFFSGSVLQPRQFAQMLLALSEVVRTHFFLPRPVILDPVVTSHPEILRLEGFSGCCGVYARVDLPKEAFAGDIISSGTTNVDFNDPMRSALNRIRENDSVMFNVGKDQVELELSDCSIIEKKVKLPVRWIKGFSEVQAYQPVLQPRIQVSAAEAARFVRSLPRGRGPKKTSFVVPMGKTIRLSQRESNGAVAFAGTHRIRVIEQLLPMAQSLRIWSDEASGISGWEVIFATGRFFLLLSPEVFRGFSGEGQVLGQLAKTDWEAVLAQVLALLQQEQHLCLDQAVNRLNSDSDAIAQALAVLGTRGLAGFDVATESFFHRELPFDIQAVEQMQPRLKSARKIVESGGVEIKESFNQSEADLSVTGSGTNHYVRLREAGDFCSCPWFSKYHGQRGPCKHLLAARMYVENQIEA